jgi:glycosyltransferase involved in cell wall biosynthesis
VKILFLEASSGQVVGGSLTGMLELIGGLDRSRYTPVVVLYEEKPVTRQLRAQGIPVRIFSKRRLPKEHTFQEKGGYHLVKGYPGVTPILQSVRAALTFLFETLPAALRLASVFRQEAPDIVHVCNGFRGNLDAVVAARLCAIPCVVHCKGFDKHSYIERFFAPGVAAAVCMTVAIEDHCRDQQIRAPEYHVIYDGLDLERFRPTRGRDDVREELGISRGAPVIGIVGNIQEWKGQHVLLEAMVAVVRAYPQAVALVVGGAHRSGRAYADSLRRFVAEHGLTNNVVFTGARQDVPDVMNAMDVIVHSSVRGEPFGRVIIEGMSVGRPVIATRAGGVPEFVHDGVDGLLVQPGDAAELSRVLIGLLEDADLRRRLSDGAERAVQNFSLEHHVEQMTALYDRIAAKQGDGRAAVTTSARRTLEQRP